MLAEPKGICTKGVTAFFCLLVLCVANGDIIINIDLMIFFYLALNICALRCMPFDEMRVVVKHWRLRIGGLIAIEYAPAACQA